MIKDASILLIDDCPDMRWAMRHILEDEGMAATEADGGLSGLDLLNQNKFDAIILDMQMPGLDGKEVLRKIQASKSAAPVIIVTAYGSIDEAVASIKHGAFEYIMKPFSNENLIASVRRALSHKVVVKSAERDIAQQIFSFMGNGDAVRSLAKEIALVADSDLSVLILGETGAGKEVVARALHNLSSSRKNPLVTVDCGAVTESLIASEFFGHEKGAFTGATSRREGWFESAGHGGTIFLDEVGNLSMSAQRTLLRVLAACRT